MNNQKQSFCRSWQAPFYIVSLLLLVSGLTPAKTFAQVNSVALNSVKVKSDNAGTYTVASSFIPGQAFVVYFGSSATGANNYFVQLSDASGSFVGAANISAPISQSGNVSLATIKMACTIPLTTAAGTYQIRVTNTGATKVSSTSAITVSTSSGFCIGTGTNSSSLVTYNMTPAECGTHFYDNGGASKIYLELSTTAGVNFNNTSSQGSITKLSLVPPHGYAVVLTYNSFDIDPGMDCGDNFQIYNGRTNASPQLPAAFATICGGAAPGPFTSTDTSGALALYYTTDNTSAGAGWDATISYIIPAPTGSASQTICGSGTVADLVATVATGASVKWYAGSIGGTALTAGTALVNGTHYYASQTAGTCESTSRLDVTVTISPQWIGGASSDWSNAANWCNGLIPTNTTDVVITGSVAHDPTISTSASCRNINVTSGHTLTVTTGGDLHLYGNFTLGGTYTNTAGTLELVGASNQTLPTLTAFNIIVNNSAGITLNGYLTVNGALTLTSGKVNTGVSYVVVNNTAFNSVVAGAGNSNYQVSWINGNITRFIATNSTSAYDLPVGNATYGNLATIKSNNLTGFNTISAYFRALTNGSNGQLVAYETSIAGNYHTPYNAVNNAGAWVIEPGGSLASGSYDVRLYFNGFTGLVDNQFGILKRPTNSTTFAEFKPRGGTINTTNGLGRKISDGFALRMGLTSFSEFVIGQSSVVLPIELTSFTAEKCNEGLDALLRWNTASEINNDHFDVEAANASDNLLFNTIGKVIGNGTTTEENEYSFIDIIPNKTGNRYYRLKQVDIDGRETYSNIVELTFSSIKSPASVTLYPNPNMGQFEIDAEGIPADAAIIEMRDLLGKTVFTKLVTLSNDKLKENITLPTTVASGIYFLRVNAGVDIYSAKVSVNK